MFGAGVTFDELLDRLHDAGAPAPHWTRAKGRSDIRLYGTIGDSEFDYIAPTLDQAARGVIDCELSASEDERQKAEAGLP